MNAYFKFLSGTRLAQNLEKLAQRNPDIAVFLNFADEFLVQYLASEDASGQKVAEILDTLRRAAPEEKAPLAASAPEPVAPPAEALPEPAAQPDPAPAEARSPGPVAAWEAGQHDSAKMNELDVEQLEKRLLLKIEASRWALERDKLIKAKVDFQSLIEPRDHALLAKAREMTNCYLWMNNPETAPIVATQNYELLSDAYAAAAQCVTFLRRVTALVDKMPEYEILVRVLRDGLYTTATAQSVLRRITSEISGRDDQDQIRLHRWLTQLTKKYRIFVNRHMKKDSLASINRVYDIPDVIKRLSEQLEKVLQKQKTLSEGFRRIKFHSAKVQEQPGAAYDWERIFDTVEELMTLGVRATDSRFAELLADDLPVLESPPPVKDYPHLNHLLLELGFWKEDANAAQVRQELQAMHYFTNHSHPHLLDEYTNIVWESDQQEVFSDPQPSGGHGRKNANVVDYVSSTLRDAMSSAFSGLETEDGGDRAGFGSGIFAEKPVKRPPAAASGVSTDEMAAMTQSARDFIKNRAILVVDTADDADFRKILEETFGATTVFVNANEICSEESLAGGASPEQVGIVLLTKDALPSDNKSVEAYCRRYDKPLLRLEKGVSIEQVARQITAALSLFR